jgi:hypothetical protein
MQSPAAKVGNLPLPPMTAVPLVVAVTSPPQKHGFIGDGPATNLLRWQSQITTVRSIRQVELCRIDKSLANDN